MNNAIEYTKLHYLKQMNYICSCIQQKIKYQLKELKVDNFAGGGGASVGIEMATGYTVDIACNHDPEAIRMHQTNHPGTRHYLEDIRKLNPLEVCKGKPVGLAWFSPDCKHFSKAKGNTPRDKKIRGLAWMVCRWAALVRPRVIILENVEEFLSWGPLNRRHHPIKSKKGQTFKKFMKQLEALGYIVEYRVLVAADYGAPTTRKRFYLIARCDGLPIVWPEQTHNKNGTNGKKPWEPIWPYLELDNWGRSIFGREKPLAKNTMIRIAKGIEKFVFNCPEPFLVQINHKGEHFRGQSIHEPLPAITGKNGHGMITPYIMQIGQMGFSKERNRSVKQPLSTIVTKNEHCLISPLLIQYHSETVANGVRAQAVTEPLKTIDTQNRYGLVIQYLTKFYNGCIGQSLWKPIHTITTSPGHFGQVSVYAVPADQLSESLDGNEEHLDETENVLQKCTWVSQFLLEYYGCGTGQSLYQPIHTIVSKDRFALITVLGNDYVILDIYLRMLKAEPELKLGQGFPPDYIIDRDYKGALYPPAQQVAKIGNSVVPIMAEALVRANLPEMCVAKRTPNLRIDTSKEQLEFIV